MEYKQLVQALGASIDPHEMRDPELHERPIPGIGTVMLDRLAWYPQSWLREHIGTCPTTDTLSLDG